MANNSSAKTVKILAVGSALGSIQPLFAKIKSIDAKHGKFEFALCVGDFFGRQDDSEEETDEITLLLEGKLEAPLECYIMQGETPIPQKVIDRFAQTGGELCKNVFLLSKSATVTTPHGLRIGCLGGVFDAEVYATAESAPGFPSPYFSPHTVQRLLSNSLSKNGDKSKNYGSLAAIQSTAASTQLIDILLSHSWPESIPHFSSVPPQLAELSALAQPLDDVARQLKPRYHFTAGNANFWEREPFVWPNEDNRVTRFVNLGPFGGQPAGGKKQRWFYAFSITPDAPTSSKPSNATKNPFTEVHTSNFKRPHEAGENYIFGDVGQPEKRLKRSAVSDKPPPGYKCKRCESSEHFISDCPERTKPPEGYVCKICNTPGHLVRDCPTRHAVGDTGGKKPRPGYVCRACGSEAHYIEDCSSAVMRSGGTHGGNKKGPPKEIRPDECWFCLSNPDLAKHLIVSIGNECYVSLAKGQLIPTQSAVLNGNSSQVPGGGHVLIVPITHYPTYQSIPSDLAAPIMDETERYKVALKQLFEKYNTSAVFFEVARLRARGGHAHVQAVPVPSGMSQKLEDAFMQEASRLGIELSEVANEAGSSGYFRVDLPNGKKLVHLMKDGLPFGLQFGREVLASALGYPHRSDWKECLLSEDEDRADAQAFKSAFASLDPSLQP